MKSLLSSQRVQVKEWRELVEKAEEERKELMERGQSTDGPPTEGEGGGPTPAWRSCLRLTRPLSSLRRTAVASS